MKDIATPITNLSLSEEDVNRIARAIVRIGHKKGTRGTRRAGFRKTRSQMHYLRRRTGLTVAEFATKIGVSAAAVYQWEVGRVAPRHTTIEKIATTFDLPLADVYTAVGQTVGGRKTEGAA